MTMFLSKLRNIGCIDFPYKNSFCLFKRMLYAWYLYGIVTLLPYHQSIWSKNSIFPAEEITNLNLIKHFTSLSTLGAVHEYYLFVVTATIFSLVLGLKCYNSRVLTLVIYFLTQNVFSLNPLLLDGGTNLAQIILLYTVFINTDKSFSSSTFRLNNFINYIMFQLCRAQLVLVYLCAGIYKLNGELWQSGMALYYILQSFAYSHPLVIKYIVGFPLLAVLGTYFALFFQVSCPYLLINKSTRKYWIIMGTLLHLGIAFVMGLFLFGAIMCIMYLLFYDDDFVKNIFIKTKRLKKITLLSSKRVSRKLIV